MARISSLLAAAAISTIGVGVAVAADLPVRARPQMEAVVAPVISWTSCYIGGHAGYSWSRFTDNSLPYAVALDGNPVATAGDPIVAGYGGHFKTSGFAGGIQGGCDKQYGQAVFGVVIDYSWTSQKRTSDAFQIAPVFPATTDPEYASVNLTSFGTARARLGYLVTPTFLIYGTGGAAWARASMSVTGQVGSAGTPFALAVSDTTNFVGWAAGIGGDWMFSPNWTFGVEYLHMDFGDANFRFGTSFPNVTSAQALGTGVNMKLSSDIVRGTINYRF